MHIVMSSDNNYAQHMGVAILSIIKNKKRGYKIIFHILDGGIQENNKNKLKLLFREQYESEIRFIHVNHDNFKIFPENGHLKLPTYYRIIAPEIICEEKLLYLDSDIIVIKDLWGLYSLNTQNKTLAAKTSFGEKYQKKIYFRPISRYFNAGVLLINTKKWKENDVWYKSIKFLENSKNHQKLKNCDQDLLNHLLEDDWLEIDEKYNVETYEYRKKIKINDIHILHFIGNHKPWHQPYINYYKKYYIYYLKMSPWSDYFNNQNKPTVTKIITHRFKVFFMRHMNQTMIASLLKLKRYVTSPKKKKS